MASVISLNSRISSYLHNIRLTCQSMPILWFSLTPCGQNIKILKVDFHDVITNELYLRGAANPKDYHQGLSKKKPAHENDMIVKINSISMCATFVMYQHEYHILLYLIVGLILHFLKFSPLIPFHYNPPILAKCGYHHYQQHFHCNFHPVIHESTLHQALRNPCQV